MSDIYQAIQNFMATHDGRRVHVYQGDTTHAGHWLLDAFPAAFRPLELTHDANREVSATPPEVPPAVPAASQPEEPPAPPEHVDPQPVQPIEGEQPAADEPVPAPAPGLTTDSLKGE